MRGRKVQQRGQIGQRHVQPLRADRWQHVRRLGHQRHPLPGHAGRKLRDDWPDQTRCRECQRPEHAAGPRHDGRLELGFGQGGQTRHLGPRLHPDHGGTGQAVAVGQGDQGERPAGTVDFGRDALVRQRMGDGETQRLLAVVPRADRDVQRLTQAGVAAIGGDHQTGGQARAVRQGDDSLGTARQQSGGRHAGAKADIGQFGQPRHHLTPQQPVGQVPAKGQVRDFGGVKILDQAGGCLGATGVDDSHDLQGCCEGCQPLPQASRLQHLPRRLQKGGGAQIGTFGGLIRDGGGGIDADHLKARRTKGRRSGQTGNAAARNQDVGVFHGGNLGPRARKANCVRSARSEMPSDCRYGGGCAARGWVFPRREPCAAPCHAARAGCADHPRTSRRGQDPDRRR